MASQIDLHCHTTASDGALAPVALVDRAVERGLQTLAITDHDTMAGYLEAKGYAAEKGLRLIPGIELSCQWRGINIHIVGLNCDPEHPVMKAAVEAQGQVRYQRAKTIADRLAKKLNTEINFADIEKLAGGEIGRPHFAQYLVDRGLVADKAQAFKKYLGAGKVGDVKSGWPEIDTAVRWIVESGGQAVMAHPHHYKMTRTKLMDCLALFKDAGGQGMEICCGLMDNNTMGNMRRIANEMELMGSCGSDFHGPNKFGLDLGVMPKFPEKDIQPIWSAFL
jgi:predicted metal-dependent phosphoesterase TrpH